YSLGTMSNPDKPPATRHDEQAVGKVSRRQTPNPNAERSTPNIQRPTSNFQLPTKRARIVTAPQSSLRPTVADYSESVHEQAAWQASDDANASSWFFRGQRRGV